MTEDDHSSTHPQLPPTTEEERFSWLRLLRSRRVGPTTFHRLLAEHGSAIAALDALPEIARAAGETSYEICPETVVEAELRAARRAGARMIAFGSPGYPALLADLPDAPPVLWAKGRADLLRQPALAMVGARNASSLGTRMARRLATDLGARGFAIVSGLARGVDTAAHSAALETGTIAVFAGGIDVIYPAENTQLAENIAETGLCLSEQPMGRMPQARHFPARNRIISGLAPAVLVVEAAARSGSLITARNALDQGREVLAVPGHPHDARAAGCNMLIRDGATLVRGADDVLEAIGPAAAPAREQQELPLDPPSAPARAASPQRSLRETAALHRQILNRLGPAPLAEDQLIRDLDAPANQVTPVLVDLELDGRITRQSGGLLSRGKG
ncbi:DNA protecting protein DprA [Salinihabitans flavidus]|uniref:DNA protecting protein DprA n=1 Tax=Salinihabitans flavidus TaxID=569882 RepID=A0A1H8U002_9RHOB|nr:DNA-processing protein DprA [Salinihabitans flavidus]SEO96467.1 DNA protecting protein DprA [Salinihabitans flavidus]